MKRVLGLVDGVEVVARAESAVAEVLEGATVNCVVAALGDDVDRRAGAAAELGFRAAGDGNLGQRVNGKNGGGAAPDAGLIDGRQVAVAIVHVGAVEQIVVGAAAVAVEAEEAIGAGGFRRTDRIAGGARDQFQQLGVVAAINRQLGRLQRLRSCHRWCWKRFRPAGPRQ